MAPETPEALDEVIRTAKDAIERFDRNILAGMSRQNTNDKEDKLW
jgi:hypothetical protein